MSALPILEIAAHWSYWDRPVPVSTPRTVPLPPSLSDRTALVVQGVRRCGKSTLLQQMMSAYELDPARCLYLNGEDPRLLAHLTWETLEGAVEAFRARHDGAPGLTFFFDEIQGFDGWQKWLRTRLEQRAGDRFVISGSNATLLSGELATTLTGRHRSIEVFPFDLAEARAHTGGLTVEEWLRDGGFPEPLDDDDGDQLRRQYFYDIVERDVRERVGARSSRTLRQVVQMVIEAAGSELSMRRIAGATGISVETAQSYIEACEAAYLLFRVPWFAWSERKRAARNDKFYPIDTGLRRVVATRTGEDRGKALECAVHLTLRRHYTDVYYWRDRGEVDFVVLEDGDPLPIQVTWDAPQDRHEAALSAFYEQYPRAREAVFVTRDGFEAWSDALRGRAAS